MKLLSYPDIGRIPMHLIDESHFTVRGKNYLEPKDVDRLLGEGAKHIQEKVDGKPFSKINGNAQLFFEDMEYQHTVPYERLPRKHLLLDVWDMVNDRWATVDEGVENYARSMGFHMVDTIEVVTEPLTMADLTGYLNSPSVYATAKIEGIVIKNYDQNLFGKIVNPEFEEAMDASVHWSKKPLVKNGIMWK